jgi:hypothetical protein
MAHGDASRRATNISPSGAFFLSRRRAAKSLMLGITPLRLGGLMLDVERRMQKFS